MPRYTDIKFIELLGEVELQGGEHAAVDCGKRIHSSFSGGYKVDPLVDPGCGVPSYLDIPYDPHAAVWVDEPVLEIDPDDSSGERHRAKKNVKPDETYKSCRDIVTKRVRHEGNPALGADGVGEKGIITVCAYHDAVFDWPRFKERLG